MENVTPIGTNGITPEFIAHKTLEGIKDVAQIFVVTIDAKEGVTVNMRGNVHGLAVAIAYLQHHLSNGFMISQLMNGDKPKT